MSSTTEFTFPKLRASSAILGVLFVVVFLLSLSPGCAVHPPQIVAENGMGAGQASGKQASTPDTIDGVRRSVVKIVVVRMDLKETPLPSSVGCPFTHTSCVVGTGFFVNDSGDVITATHVLDEVTIVVRQLTALGIPANPVVSMEIRNNVSENGDAFIGNQSVFPFKVRISDRAHDLTVVSPIGPLAFHALPATLDPGQSRDGAEIFACGYPLGALELTTTFGRVATTWAMYKLSTADYESEVLRLDLKANVGNSGGPIFDIASHNVIGVAVEQTGDASAPIIIAVPAVYVADLLSRGHIPVEAPTGK